MNEYKGPNRLPVAISGEQATTIMEDVVNAELDRIKPMSRAIFEDDIFPGEKKMGKRQRTAHYVVLTDPQDFEPLHNLAYISLYQAGLLPPLVSPYWRNYLALPDEFRKAQRDFIDCMDDILAEAPEEAV